MSNFYHNLVRVDIQEGQHEYSIPFPDVGTTNITPINFSVVEPEKYPDMEIRLVGEQAFSDHIVFLLSSNVANPQVLFDLGFWY